MLDIIFGNRFYVNLLDLVPGLVYVMFSMALIITIITYLTGSAVGNTLIDTKKLIKLYVLCDDSKLTLDVNTYFQNFNTISLSKEVSLTFLGNVSISLTTVGLIIFTYIIPNLGRIVDFISSSSFFASAKSN